MTDLNFSDLGPFWDKAIETLRTTGVDFGIDLVTAIAIFYVGRLVVGFQRSARWEFKPLRLSLCWVLPVLLLVSRCKDRCRILPPAS